MNKVNGFLESAKSRGFTLEAKGSNGNEVLGIKLRNPIKRVQNFWSIFNKKKNNDFLNFGSIRIFGSYKYSPCKKTKWNFKTKRCCKII